MQRLQEFYQAKRAQAHDNETWTSALSSISVGTAPLLIILAILLAITLLNLGFVQDAHADQLPANTPSELATIVSQGQEDANADAGSSKAVSETPEADATDPQDDPQMRTVTYVNVIDGTQTREVKYKVGTRVQFNAGTYAGHTFKCWNVTKGTIPDFTDSAKNATITSFTMPDEDIELTAEWTEIQYIDASFNFNGSTGNNISPKDPSYITDEKVEGDKTTAKLAVGKTININAGTREGYIFDHWAVESGSPNVIFANKNTASTSFTVPNKNIKIVAVWKKTWKVTIEGSYAKDNSGAGSYSENTNVRINAGTHPDKDMRFDGWTYVCDKEIKFTPNADAAVAYFMMPGANIKLTAKWTKMGTVSNNTDTKSNLFGADLVGTGTEIANKVYKSTSDEMTAINKGSDASFRLTVKELAASAVSATDKSLVKTAMGSNTLAYYMDICLYSKIGGNAEKKITETAQRVTIKFTLTNGQLAAPAGYKRTFKIISLHGSTASLLTPTYTYDSKTRTGTLTFTTDQFSTYALVYTDTKESGADDSGNTNRPTDQISSGLNSGGSGGAGGSYGSPDTSDKSCEGMLTIFICMLGFAGLAILVRRMRKLVA